MVKDFVADLITSLKSGSESRKESIVFPYSKFLFAIAEALERSGFVSGVSKKGKKISKSIEIKLIYKDEAPRIIGVERVSKLSKRIYKSFKDIHPVRNGFGSTILSTTKGILNDREARAQKLGGEVLFKIW